MRTARIASDAASPRLNAKDMFVRYILVPLIMVIGLYGLINYAVTGKGGNADKFGAPAIEAPLVP